MRSRGVDFAEVRPYQPGDDVRNIDWRVTARRAKPHTKLFREERERPTLIVVDQTQRMFFGTRRCLKSVAAAELAARIAWTTLAAEDRVGGIVVDNERATVFKPRRSPRAVARFLAAVALANQRLGRAGSPPPAAHWESIGVQVLRLARVVQRVVVISDFAAVDDAARRLLARAARRVATELYYVFDPVEEVLPTGRRYAVADGAARVEFDGDDVDFRAAYTARFRADYEALAEMGRRYGMRVTPVSTEADLQRVSRAP